MDIKVKQLDTTDCGAACLASLARYYNLILPIATIRQRAGTDKKGTNILGIIEAAESFGFEAKGVKAAFENLSDLPLPAIAHLEIKKTQHHFVVISSLTKSHVVVMDPCDGKLHKRGHNDFKGEWTGILILAVPSDNFPPAIKRENTLCRFWKLVIHQRKILILALLGALVYTILGLSTSIFIQKVVDHVFVERNHQMLHLMAVSMILLAVLRVIISAAKDVFILRTGQLIDFRLILGYYKHLLNLPQQFFDTMRVGEITSRIGDAVKIRVFVNDVSINLIISLCMLISSFVLMFTYYWKLALLMLLIVPVYFSIFYISNTLNKGTQRRLMKESAELESQLFESLNGIATIKRLALEKYSNNQTESKFMILLRTVYRSGLNSIFSGTSTEFSSQLLTIILLWIGSGLVLNQHISAGELLSFYTLTGYFTVPVSSLIGANRQVQDAIIATERLYEIMDLEGEFQDDSSQVELTGQNMGNLRFSELSFRYGARENVFSNLSLEIPLKAMTGIIGESGCGKSTLIALLLKIYPSYTGRISVGAHSIKDLITKSLRERIALVPQCTELFSASILTNITIGEEEINMEQVSRICTQLGISGFIKQFPDGLQTIIGEKGVALSGGQRQRIAIARALYRDPEILILDEATSSLDAKSERYVQNAIRDFLGKGKTVIIIAHRLSTVQSADKIIVLKDGSVKEEGTHSELLALGSEYYNMWTRDMYVMKPDI